MPLLYHAFARSSFVCYDAKLMKRPFIVLLTLVLGLQMPAFAGALYEQLSRAGEVKVVVAQPTDVGTSQLDLAAFKKSLEAALQKRKSIHFVIAESDAGAKLRVETEVRGFQFSLTDPVDMLIGVGGAALDAAKNEHFASIDAQMTVKDASGAVRWSRLVHASITDEKMSETEARGRILDRAAAVFVKEAFGKK